MNSTIEAALITAGISLVVLFIQRAFDGRTQKKNDARHKKDMQALSKYLNGKSETESTQDGEKYYA